MKTTMISLAILIVSAGSGLCDSKWPNSIPATTSTSSRLVDTSIPQATISKSLELALEVDGEDEHGRDAVARAPLPSSFQVDRKPHRRFRVWPRVGDWVHCSRVVYDDGSRQAFLVGCAQRDIRGNNHVVPDFSEVVLNFWCDFDVPTQSFLLDQPQYRIPAPKTLSPGASWMDLKVHVPLPLTTFTTVDAATAIRARGARVVDGAGLVDAVVLPDWADYCTFDRRSRPKEATVWLRRGVSVIWERHLVQNKTGDDCPEIQPVSSNVISTLAPLEPR